MSTVRLKLAIHLHAIARQFSLLLLASTALISLPVAFILRFDLQIPPRELRNLAWGIVIAVVAKPVIYFAFRLHHGWWNPATVADLWRVLKGTLLAGLMWGGATFLILGPGFPRTIYVLDFIVNFGIIATGRLMVRVAREAARRKTNGKYRKNVLIYGAGRSGWALAGELQENGKLGYRILGFIDDNPLKRNELIAGESVLCEGRNIPRIIDRLKLKGTPVHEILIAMPSATGPQMRQATAYCRAAQVTCRTLPGIGDLLTDRILSSQIRDVSVEDLLSRVQVQLNEGSIRESLEGRCVLVTGAGGSIGSELCRQICGYKPARLVALDQAESDLFRIQMELLQRFPEVEVVAQLGDIRNPGRVNELLSEHDVDSVFHSAAYKHVPLSEENSLETAETNILGTWNLALAAARSGVRNFVMISSDKAVNPTNVMGATKRVAELIVSSMHDPGDPTATDFVSVRFGNVLGSNGSVVPIFKQQIAAGGPVTVTHPEMRRYFMTIREATQLVLQASTMGKGAQTFVLDMGEPVKIVDLARNMIRLSGLVPDEDIEIRFTGLRPGEKLFEELAGDSDRLQPTYHAKIKIFQGLSPSNEQMRNAIQCLEDIIRNRDEEGLIIQLQHLVPEYQASRYSVGRKAASSAASGSGEVAYWSPAV